MFPIPVKVTNVKVYPYFEWHGGGVGPVILPVVDNATGSYSVGTLTTNIFYNLNLTGGQRTGTLAVHGRYFATGETEDGSPFTTHWMYCLNNSDSPTFGLTVNMRPGNTFPTPAPIATPPYIVLSALTDITVSQVFPPPAIGQTLLITNGTGNIIATQVGTPHETGVEITTGTRVSHLIVGSKNVIITGKNKDGSLVTLGGLTCISVDEPAVFLRELV
ncbi:hypothetical protein SAMN05421788_108226 [Filimonas lacunae]|uniref:Uncharacterized protein n=1 Tax=Filimonas lacunae TaxID=477680 RepID=A0A173MDX0_9BACT|nr:hypothetical protein [Filimonas lacunae]BAV05628.1 hypothetical protein FLA_1639 [Filimonas lacunae]SIT29135.1 hypothetical protein SAMN05421788_108226 [Filimonas lacunae]